MFIASYSYQLLAFVRARLPSCWCPDLFFYDSKQPFILLKNPLLQVYFCNDFCLFLFCFRSFFEFNKKNRKRVMSLIKELVLPASETSSPTPTGAATMCLVDEYRKEQTRRKHILFTVYAIFWLLYCMRVRDIWGLYRLWRRKLHKSAYY